VGRIPTPAPRWNFAQPSKPMCPLAMPSFTWVGEMSCPSGAKNQIFNLWVNLILATCTLCNPAGNNAKSIPDKRRLTYNKYMQENPRINRQDREKITFHGSAYHKIPQQCTLATHTEAVNCQGSSWGLPSLSLTTKGSWIPWREGCQTSCQPTDASNPYWLPAFNVIYKFVHNI